MRHEHCVKASNQCRGCRANYRQTTTQPKSVGVGNCSNSTTERDTTNTSIGKTEGRERCERTNTSNHATEKDTNDTERKTTRGKRSANATEQQGCCYITLTRSKEKITHATDQERPVIMVNIGNERATEEKPPQTRHSLKQWLNFKSATQQSALWTNQTKRELQPQKTRITMERSDTQQIHTMQQQSRHNSTRLRNKQHVDAAIRSTTIEN